MINNKLRIAAALLAMSAAGSTLAAVSAEEAKQLGTTLTPWGAEKAGNKEGTIPAYTGEGSPKPDSWNPKEPILRPNPYANEKPLFTITAQNYQQYADKLDGLTEMFKRYPNYRMDIYPTHRTARFPKYVNDNSLKNATSCKTSEGGNAIVGCYGGTPFPIPKDGHELMWNHTTTYEAENWRGVVGGVIVTTSGKYVVTSIPDAFQSYSKFFDPKKTTPLVGTDLYTRVRLDYVGPARQVGEKLVVLDPIDPVNVGRRVYSYIPGQRRVKLAPDLAYDTPSPVTGGGSLMDEGKGFYGALDRYDWKLIGKKEKFIQYNTFDQDNYKVCPLDKMYTPKFPNPDCIRWELHRVWVVEAKLKPGFRHVYPRRIMFWDEDGHGAGMVENYDAAGKLWRFTEQMMVPFYEAPYGQFNDGSTTIDIQNGTYCSQGSHSDKGWGWQLTAEKDQFFFSPESLAGEGIR